MFNKLKSLVELLNLTNPKSYTQCRDNRKILQDIKNEAQELRFTITKNFKDSNVKEVEETKEEIIEEPKLVQDTDEDFFAGK